MKMKQKSSPLIELQNFLREVVDRKYFGSRKEFNDETITYLLKGDQFKQDVVRIRKALNLPKLNEGDDIVVPQDELLLPESIWLSSQSKEIQIKFEAEINRLIQCYHLPRNFVGWLRHFVLYGKPAWKSHYNFDLTAQVLSDPKELERIGLTTQEKDFIKEQVRKILGIIRRPNQQASQLWGKLLRRLNSSKNSRRRFRRLESAIKTTRIRQKVQVYDFRDGKYQKVTEPFTYDKLVVREYPDEEGYNDSKHNQRLRKQHQRLKDRVSKVLGRGN